MKKIFISCLLSLSLVQAGLLQDIINDKSTLRHYYMPLILISATLPTAIIKGNDSRMGKTVWQSLDAVIISAIATEGLKNVFGRIRPRDTNVDIWFQQGSKSFPSGHVTAAAAIVTPYILEYKDDTPWVHLLWLIPAQQMIGRVADKAHYPTDALGGLLVGYISGYYAHEWDTPLLLSWIGDGIYAGINFDF